MHELAEGVVAATEYRRVTVGAIATGQGIICIDVPPYPVEARHWRSRLLEHFKQPIRVVILTDAHRDRVLGLHWFDDAPVVAHDATFTTLANLPANFVDQAADQISRDSEERLSFSSVRLRLPRVTFSDKMQVYVEDYELPLVAMPGPTPGNLWIHLPDARVVFTGDSVVPDLPPFAQRAQTKAWLDSLTALRRPRFAADVVVPGRGPLTDKEATNPISEFIRQARRFAQKTFQPESSPQELAVLVPDFLAQAELSQAALPHEEGSEGFRRAQTLLESIYAELRQEAKA